jgi:hypothetical protein
MTGFLVAVIVCRWFRKSVDYDYDNDNPSADAPLKTTTFTRDDLCVLEIVGIDALRIDYEIFFFIFFQRAVKFRLHNGAAGGD